MLPFSIIKKIAEELDSFPDEWTGYLNRSTGEVYFLSDEDAALFEEDSDDDSLPQWQRDALPKIREVLEGRRGIEERWFQFKSEAMEQIVVGWLDAQQIPYSTE